MSLVAYDGSSGSSDDESSDNENITTKVELKTIHQLPKPIKEIPLNHVDDGNSPLSFRLPEPKSSIKGIIEEDDEFLYKKEIASVKPPRTKQNKVPVRITIPSLKDFSDEDMSASVKPNLTQTQKLHKPSGLLALLPQPNSSQLFANKTVTSNVGSTTKSTSLLPYSLMKHKKEADTRANNKIKNNSSLKLKSNLVSSYSDSEESDENEDFFSLNKNERLPTVSVSEINKMVANKALKLAETSQRFDSLVKEKEEEHIEKVEMQENYEYENNSYNNLEQEAIQQLCGSSVKRKRDQQEFMNVVDISHEQVMPDRNDWMRNALAQSTQYVPKGKLTDEELIPGSKRKHQITYLAHQAKANESELQAMWSNNRQSRRQTQSKYGF